MTEKVEEVVPKDPFDKYDFLYPDLDDTQFAVKIAKRKEFNDAQMSIEVKNIEEEAERMCNAAFELSPHQQFVKNYLSVNTPYNTLLLYHGLGTGKTCSAIGVTEEMRNYMKQMGITRRMIIVASPNVQENFRAQLFDERKLKKTNGIWHMEGCSGQNFLREINPMNMKNMDRDKVIRIVQRTINAYYVFMGYVEFANYIDKVSSVPDDLPEERAARLKKKKLEKAFLQRMIVIDEVHNIRMSDDNKQKRVANSLMGLIDEVPGMKLLLLSATPMFNSYKEIVWLLNLMNKNDRRPTIAMKDIFDTDGNLLVNEAGEEVGKEMLLAKSRGYVSFVRGDNPYTFPFRILPQLFAPENSYLVNPGSYPSKTMVQTALAQGMEYLDTYRVTIGDEQWKGYQEYKVAEQPDAESMERFGYTALQKPLEALNMVYPLRKTAPQDTETESKPEQARGPNYAVGKDGLDAIMTHKTSKTPPLKYDYEYRSEVERDFGRIFSPGIIGKFSSKIKTICDAISNSKGIVLVYSQYIDGGLVPMALALEEMGLIKRTGRPLLKRSDEERRAKPVGGYVMITGDKQLSPDNAKDVKLASSLENTNGELIKVILISKAGSEGLDFKNIRQVHVMEPWYNTNRTEQIIGRAVRTCSHINLPFLDRNVMIYLYGTQLPDDSEAADLYVYRLAERKALQIGAVTRVLKEGAVDCLLNASQQMLTAENMQQSFDIELSNGKKVNLNVGDQPFTQLCDFMKSCEYTCQPNATIQPRDIKFDTYDEVYLLNNEKIKRRIKDIFKEHYVVKRDKLISLLTNDRKYPLVQIFGALDILLKDRNEMLVDKYGRFGNLIHIGDLYAFQPVEIKDEHISTFDRSRPLSYKRPHLEVTGRDLRVMQPDEADVPQRALSEPSVPVSRQQSEALALEKGPEIIASMQVDFNKTRTPMETKRSDVDWYVHASNALVLLRMCGIPEADLFGFVVDHQLDFLLANAKLTLLNYLYFTKTPLTDFEQMIKEHLDKKIIAGRGIFIQESSKKSTLYVLNKEQERWTQAEESDTMELQGELKSMFDHMMKNMSNEIGYVILFRNKFFVFKTRVRSEKRKRGARCDQATKQDTMKLLKNIIPDSTCDIKALDPVGNKELCVYMEMLMRFYNKNETRGKVWFIPPEYSEILKVES